MGSHLFVYEVPSLQGSRFVQTLQRIGTVLLAIGLLGTAFTAVLTPERLAPSYILGFFYVLSITVTATFLSALLFLVRAGWSATVRRSIEFIAAPLPLLLLGLLPLAIAPGLFFHWIHELHAGDPIIASKGWFLNEPFLAARLILYGVAWGFMYRSVIGNSLRQDLAPEGDYTPTLCNFRQSAVWVLVYALTFTFASVDLLMALEPHWYSTIFGVYSFAASFTATLSAVILLVVALREQGYLRDFVTDEHYHDLGKLLFAFCIFWAYIAFSQYMLIWYGNLPEETVYFLKRMGQGTWQIFGIFLPALRFVLPFVLLLRRDAKRNPRILMAAAITVLLGHYIDIAWIVLPAFAPSLRWGWQEIAVLAAWLGIALLLITRQMQRVPAVAYRDPYLQESLHTVSG
ncbi:MAG: quinol:cytochrome C oxidoreductase [Chlorobiota bacterium]